MCPEEKQPSFTGSEGGRSCNGPMMEKSTASDSPQVSEDIGSTMEKARRKKRKRETFATAESPRRVKRKICDDKSSTCSQSIQGTTLYKTSPADSTSKEKAFGPFFDPRCKKMSEQLSSLTKIDWRDSDIQSWNSSLKKEELNCGVSLRTNINPRKKNSSMTFYPSSQSSAVEYMVPGSINVETRVRKVRLYPNQKQKQQFKKWFGDTRYTYNAALDYTRKHQHEFDMIWLRNRLVINQNLPYSKAFLKHTPKHIREGAIKDLVTARKAALSNMTGGNIKKFELGFRSKRQVRQSIVIPKAALRVCPTGLHIYKQFTKSPVVCNSKKVLVDHDCRLVCDGGMYFLCIPTDIPVCVSERKREFCAIDPGVRCFATLYSLNGVACYGEDMEARLTQRLLRLDKLRSKIDMEKRKRNRRRKKDAFHRLSSSFQNVQRDMHYKMANHMCERFTDIILPRFRSQQMSRKENRQLKTKTVRSMCALSHGKFRSRLIETGLLKGVVVHDCLEPYTTKSCSSCGTINDDIGSKKIFECFNCSMIADRDVNASKNIMLKFMKEQDMLLGTHACA